jgi:quercetin dioxygenase-like cupin family protein
VPDLLRIDDALIRMGDAPGGDSLDVLGTTVEFLSWAQNPAANFCIIRRIVPPGVTIPLHTYDDPEDIFVVSGTQEVLVDGPGGLRWRHARTGDFVRIPRAIPHAYRNVANERVVALIVTTTRVGEFLKEIGSRHGEASRRPTPAQLMLIAATAERHGITLGTARDNAAVGIDLPSSPKREVAAHSCGSGRRSLRTHTHQGRPAA